MFQVGLFGVGLALICLSVVMVVVARPRKGLVVGFLDGNVGGKQAVGSLLSVEHQPKPRTKERCRAWGSWSHNTSSKR